MDYGKLKSSDPELAEILEAEEARQNNVLSLVPSENHPSSAVLEALSGVFTGKYAEGYPGKRYYGGNENTDKVENLARKRACKLFGADPANVQALSGSNMHMAIYLALLEPGDTVLAMDLSHGGHLSHGSPVSHTGRLFNFVYYKTDLYDGSINYGAVRGLAKLHKPKMVLVGYTSYPRDYDYDKFKEIADEVGAITFADISHTSGLVAGGVLENPFDHDFDVVATTTHKSLRGPRAGLIMCKKEYAEAIDKSVFPGLQGGPHMDNIAAMAVELGEAGTREYKKYAKQILENAKALANKLTELGVQLVTGGTDNHLMVVDTIKSFEMSGKYVESVLESVGIVLNKQIVPDDPNPPLKPSGIRLGTPAVTTRGMGEEEMEKIATLIVETIKNKDNQDKLNRVKEEIGKLCANFPVNSLTK